MSTKSEYAMKRKLSQLALVAASMALLTVVTAAEVFDPPAISVFPEHEAIGKRYSLTKAIADGRALFAVKFNVLDGVGRPFATGDSKPTPRLESGPAFHRISGPDANSCFGCHSQPRFGGSGDLAANVFFGAQFADPIVETVRGERSNERNTPSLFGVGAIEIAAREITSELHEQRTAAMAESRRTSRTVDIKLSSKGTNFGEIRVAPDGYIDYSNLLGIDPDLVVKPFGTKGVAISLREFTIAALNHHHGIQAVERFGWERTGVHDFDGDGKEVEFTVGQTSALVLFQATLPSPRQNYLRQPGFKSFQAIGCANCHRPRTYLKSNVFVEPNPFNRPGSLTPTYTSNVIRAPLPIQRDAKGYFIEAFTDFRRHVMCDNNQRRLCNEELKQDNVPLNQFMTARLWDLATSAPYCHRGDCSTLTEAIRSHGGEAKESLLQFEQLNARDKRKLIAFLLTLGNTQK